MADRIKRPRYAETVMEENYRRSRRHLARGIIALGFILLTGAIWYKYVEGWTWIDAIYMSVITLTTVGFGETNPLTARGESLRWCCC